MLESIIAEIDAEIARLTSAKAILSGGSTVATKRKPGRPAKTVAIAAKSVPTQKRPVMSAEAKERIRQAQIKRWAAVKKASKANLSATGAPIAPAKKAVIKKAPARKSVAKRGPGPGH